MVTNMISSEEEVLRKIKKTRTLRKTVKLFFLIAVVAWGIVSLFPMYWMFVTSFTYIGPSFTMKDIKWFPDPPTLQNYKDFMQLEAPWWIERRPWKRWFLNSLLVALIPTLSNLVFDSMAGYSLAKLRFPGRNTLFWLIIVTMTIPEFVPLIPLYKMMYDFNWINTYWALLFPGFAGVGGVFLFKQNIQTLPSGLIDAARIDGASEFKIFWRIVMPLSKPILALMGIVGFVGGWNSYFWPYLVTNSSEMFTIQVGLTGLMGAGAFGIPPGVEAYGEIFAGAVLAAIPVIVIFFAFQKYFVKGIAVGAFKG